MKAILGKIKRQIKVWIWGECTECGGVGTMKYRGDWTDWVVCRECGYAEYHTRADW